MKKVSLWITLLALGLIAQPVLAGVSLSINQIRIDQPGADDDEYFELYGAPSTSLDGLTYLVIGDGAGGSGTIEAVVDLTGNSLDANGYFVVAEGTFTLGVADLTANLNFENSDNVTHLLVADFTGADGDDLDTNDDCVLDVTPWSSIVDSIGLNEDFPAGECLYGGASVGPDGTFVPGHVFRCPDGAGSFLIGAFDPVGGNDTPGAANDCPVDIFINEIRIDQPGGDDDEYFELFGPEGASLDGLWYVTIGDGAAGSGVVETAVDLTGNSIGIGSGGFFVAAEGTFTLGVADLMANLNFENSDNVTHLLVRDFTGAVDDDLDTNDDCTLDVTPWSEIVDQVGLSENFPMEDCLYGPVIVGPDGTFVPGHVFRCTDGTGDWGIGPFDPVGGLDSPGATNPEAFFITDQPNSQTVFEGSMAVLAIATNGGGNVTYQWRKGGVDLVDGGSISGATTDTLTIDPVMVGDAGDYDCVVASNCGMLTSDLATLTVGSLPAVAINEIRIDQGGTDNDEYFELVGAPGTSLDGLTYIVIGDATPEIGIIEAVISLDGLVIPADGHFLAVEDTFTLDLACGDVPDLILSGAGNGINFENSDNVTHMLVAGFTGMDGDDLDANDDCTLDVLPWATIVDEVGLSENFPMEDCLYSANIVGPDGSFVPGHVFRCPNQTGAFQIGSFSPTCGSTESPGLPNPPCFDTNPASQLICEGDPVVFTASAMGSGVVTYQWQKDGVDLVDDARISGAMTDTLTIDPVYAADAGDYTCVATDDNTSGSSAAGTLTVELLYDARVGTVNGGVGAPQPVLYINGSAGNGPERELFIDPNTDNFEMVIQAPPSLSQAKYAVYIWFDTPTKDTREELPEGTGDIAMPTPLTGDDPQPFWIANNLKPALGTTVWFPAFSPIEKAPAVLIDVKAPIPRENRTFYVQGVIQDPNAPNGLAAATNGILVTVGPLNP